VLEAFEEEDAQRIGFLTTLHRPRPTHGCPRHRLGGKECRHGFMRERVKGLGIPKKLVTKPMSNL
jgi:hypothetical protein